MIFWSFCFYITYYKDFLINRSTDVCNIAVSISFSFVCLFFLFCKNGIVPVNFSVWGVLQIDVINVEWAIFSFSF